MSIDTSVIPIFIIVHDRIIALDKAVKSYLKFIKTPIKIIFHDVASTYGPCLEYLENKRKEGYEVYRSEKNHHLTVMDTIKNYMNKNPQYEYFVMTDPDIELDNVNGDILEFYKYLSIQNNNEYVVGPMLRIDDIPDYYPYKKNVIQSHTSQFWHKTPININYKGNTYQIQYSLIDTTFQLVHRSLLSSTFARKGIRCYPPYSARHLDWYLDPNNLTDDQIYYSKKSTDTATWGRNIHKVGGSINKYYHKYHKYKSKYLQLKFSQFGGNNRNLVIVTSVIHTLNDNLGTVKRSLFTSEQRLSHTLKTIQSIKKHIPNPYIVIIEGSNITEDEIQSLKNAGCDKIHFASENTKKLVNGKSKSLAEINLILEFLESFENLDNFDTFSKISGRYYLTDNFKWDKYPLDRPLVKCRTNDYCDTRYYRVPIKNMNLFKQHLKDALANDEIMKKLTTGQIDIEGLNILSKLPNVIRLFHQNNEILGVKGFLSCHGDEVED